MEKINQITTGKAKSLYTTNDEQYLVMEFRDDTSCLLYTSPSPRDCQ